MSEDHVRDDSEHDPSVPIDEDERKGEVSRRSFLRWSALAGAGASVAGAFPAAAADEPRPQPEPARDIVEATIAQLQAAMERGGLRSQDLVNLYLPGAFEGYPLRKDFPLLSRMVKPWPGIVDVEPMPDEAGSDAAAQPSEEAAT